MHPPGVDPALEAQVRAFLGVIVQAAGTHPLKAGYRYAGPADLVLQTGQVFTPQPLPARYRPGVPKQCFDNAYRLAGRSRGRLRYCEGYAAGIFPVEHAWCLDQADQVVDPTWTGDRLGTVYLGLVLPLSAVRAVRSRRLRATTTVLFDWAGGYPLCQGQGDPQAAAPSPWPDRLMPR